MGIRLTERRRSILITDDDAVARESLREALEPEGFQTYLASCGEEAIDIVRERDVHVALLDMHLPRLTGLETLKIVKEIKRPLPCIILTADVSEHLLHEALSLEAFSVIGKPFSKHLVVYMVSRALRRREGSPGRPRQADPDEIVRPGEIWGQDLNFPDHPGTIGGDL